MSEDFLKVLREANGRRQDDWKPADGTELSVTFLSNELAEEVGEVCGVVKKLEREALGMVGSRKTPEDLAEELADVLICADRIADRFGIDLRLATVAKFNKTSRNNGLNHFIDMAALSSPYYGEYEYHWMGEDPGHYHQSQEELDV